jgi:NAD(P)-dependent dehydrogenase (short-subunit alcohol dehydrogenase family)
MANQITSQTLSRRLKGTSITANALHPGFVSSEIGVRNGWTVGFVWNLLTLIAISPERGAETSIYRHKYGVTSCVRSYSPIGLLLSGTKRPSNRSRTSRKP